jgi:hypothetical protein
MVLWTRSEVGGIEHGDRARKAGKARKARKGRSDDRRQTTDDRRQKTEVVTGRILNMTFTVFAVAMGRYG